MEHKISDNAAELRRAYQKKWRSEHKDRIREYNRRFWEKRAEKESENAEKATQEN